jgi:hypothetical protein
MSHSGPPASNFVATGQRARSLVGAPSIAVYFTRPAERPGGVSRVAVLIAVVGLLIEVGLIISGLPGRISGG